MGSFRASFEFGGNEYDVLYSNFEFSRNTDSKGKPSSNVLGGRVHLVIESTEDTTVIEGKIVFKKTDEDAKMKEVTFKNAYVVNYKETLDVTNDVPMRIDVTFSAEEISVGDAILDNR